MIKAVGLLGRREGMTVEEFREYYESTHRRIGEKYLAGNVAKYMRRYLDPSPNGRPGATEPEYDVILEIWYEDQEQYDRTRKVLSDPDARREIAEDEARLFNPARMHFFTVTEVVSDL